MTKKNSKPAKQVKKLQGKALSKVETLDMAIVGNIKQ